MKPQVFQWPIPPSVNGLYFNTGRGRRAKAKPYREWIKDVGDIYLVRTEKMPPFEGPIEVHYRVHPFQDKRRRDLENYVKALSDQLTRLNIIEDDSQIIRSTIEWGLASGGVRIVVQEAVRIT